MEKEKFDRNKTNVNIGIIGHVDHGKTTLTAAITRVFNEQSGRRKAIAYEKVPEESKSGIIISRSHVEYETDTRHYAHIDFPSHIDYVKNMIIGADQMDGVILVVSATDGPMSQTREQILLSRQVGVSYLVVFLNKAEMVEDDELLELVEMEVRALLNEYDFSGDDTPIVIGSALRALEDPNGEWGDKILELMKALDSWVPDKQRDTEKPFLMPVEDVLSMTNRGTAAAGRVERGSVKVGEEVEIVGMDSFQKTVVTSIEIFHKLTDEGCTGDNVHVLLREIDRTQIERGQVLAKPGSITPHTHYRSEVYALTKEEGGDREPLLDGYHPRFYFRTTDVTGVIRLPEGVTRVMPGDHVQMEIELIRPIAIEEGLRFEIRDDERTIAFGVVTQIIED